MSTTMSLKFPEVGNFQFDPKVPYDGVNPFLMPTTTAPNDLDLATSIWARILEGHFGEEHSEPTNTSGGSTIAE